MIFLHLSDTMKLSKLLQGIEGTSAGASFLYFVRSGYVSLTVGNDSTSRNVSLYGYDRSRFALDWSSVLYTPGSLSASGYFHFNRDTALLPSNASQRFLGTPLRCLSTAVEGEESGKPTYPSKRQLLIYVIMSLISYKRSPHGRGFQLSQSPRC